MGIAVLTVAVCAYAPATSRAEQSVRLQAGFSPKRPGQRTSAEFNIQIAAPNGRVPSPLTQASVRYPAGLGLALSGLGIDTCSRETLELIGLGGCPASSYMGEGSAMAEIQFGPEILREQAHIALLRTPEENGQQLAMLFLVNAEEPVSAQPILNGLLLPASRPYGGRIDIAVPLVESLPGAPDVAVVQLHLVIGPRGLTYYEHVGGKLVPYHPRGLRLPNQCPRGGYPFALALGFLDGTSATATASVPCPRASPRLRRLRRLTRATR
jgi:hypothetical protein